jgi:hypothetical protein
MKMQKIYLVGGRGNGLKALKVKKRFQALFFRISELLQKTLKIQFIKITILVINKMSNLKTSPFYFIS